MCTHLKMVALLFQLGTLRLQTSAGGFKGPLCGQVFTFKLLVLQSHSAKFLNLRSEFVLALLEGMVDICRTRSDGGE